MKGTDLMIGDWVKWDNHYLQTKGTGETDSYFKIDDTCSFLPNDELEPIPLTREILELNGWRHYHIETYGYDSDACNYYYNHNIYPRYAKISGDKNKCFIDFYVNYVHLFQHALRLCGLHDLANNFKIK